ncbi:PDZK1-interacting protein 1 [Notechis scutatus]|uniref:PDZK1-interacting protein 1 n=1 Tax=Notechis scutatus TaxID=8663 RepID=A0A6J1U181_9SAUR|nr:PDZK1-interacting protein 1 [Notechis scutatus]XP_026521600.1 PDZK1-interacting protein 1 [Notechis scutatus]
MKSFLFVTFCFFAAWDPVNCQAVYRVMEPWLQGVIAVIVFLVLAMMAFVINKLWCQDEKDLKKKDKQVSFMNGNTNESIFSNGMEGRYSATAADFSCEEDPHAYENKVEFECDTMTVHHNENHVNDGFQCGTMTECHTESCAHVTTDM